MRNAAWDQEHVLTREEFEKFLNGLRQSGASTVGDVDFTRVTEEQCTRVLDVLFGNQKARART